MYTPCALSGPGDLDPIFNPFAIVGKIFFLYLTADKY